MATHHVSSLGQKMEVETTLEGTLLFSHHICSSTTGHSKNPLCWFNHARYSLLEKRSTNQLTKHYLMLSELNPS